MSEHDEATVPLSNLIAVAKELTPGISISPDRAILVISGKIKGIWRSKMFPEPMIGLPVMLCCAGTRHSRIAAWKAREELTSFLEHSGIQIPSTEDVNAMTGHIAGFVVPYRSVGGADAQAQYQDPVYDKFWCPLAQVWRFQNPIPFKNGKQHVFYIEDQRPQVLAEMRTATRIL